VAAAAGDTVYNLPLAARMFLYLIMEDPASGRALATLPSVVDFTAVAPALHPRRRDLILMGHAGAHHMVEW